MPKTKRIWLQRIKWNSWSKSSFFKTDWLSAENRIVKMPTLRSHSRLIKKSPISSKQFVKFKDWLRMNQYTKSSWIWNQWWRPMTQRIWRVPRHHLLRVDLMEALFNHLWKSWPSKRSLISCRRQLRSSRTRTWSCTRRSWRGMPPSSRWMQSLVLLRIKHATKA